MDDQTLKITLAVIGLLQTLLIAFGKVIWANYRDLKAKVEAQANELMKMEITMARHMATSQETSRNVSLMRDDINRQFQGLKEDSNTNYERLRQSIVAIFNKLDTKADK